MTSITLTSTSGNTYDIPISMVDGIYYYPYHEGYTCVRIANRGQYRTLITETPIDSVYARYTSAAIRLVKESNNG